MKLFALPKDDWRLIVGGAVLVTIAYPPFHLILPSFLCVVPAILLILDGEQDPSPFRRHLVQGFWFGLLAHGLTLYWMVVALWHFTPLSGLGYAATIVILALYMSLVFAVSGWVTRTTKVSLVITFPVLWTAAEWVIGHQGEVGFPWLGLGSSLTGYPVLVQIADIVGARGITMLLVLANVALALAWVDRRQRARAPVLVGGVVIGVIVAAAYGVVRERALPLRPVGTIALLQPNVGFEEKWEPGAQDSILYATLDLARTAISETAPDVVIWPEAAVPGYFHRHAGWRADISELSRTTGVPQLVGGLDLEWESADEYDYFNAAFWFDETGDFDRQPVYHKRYLVPITERVPFVNPRWFKLRFFGGFGIGRERAVYETPVGRFGVFICYESAFEDLPREYRARGADFLVNITNDAWFGRTSAPYQHAAHLVMRAIETRAGIARAANSGISEFVDPLGREHRRTGLYQMTFVTDTLMTSDVVPFYTRVGDWVGLLSLVMTVGLVGFAFWSRR
ncbi:MAG: apolipoprotein N-acyltransferase [Gemmatimonadota bacterium]|nr:apolipoprotein N-acyltransferase [Gemmatimonadota bacterium]